MRRNTPQRTLRSAIALGGIAAITATLVGCSTPGATPLAVRNSATIHQTRTTVTNFHPLAAGDAFAAQIVASGGMDFGDQPIRIVAEPID